MERLIGHVSDVLCTHFETAVVGPSRAKFGVQPAKFSGVPLLPVSLFLATSYVQAIRVALGFRPDFCFAGSGLTAPATAAAARSAHARFGVYVHGLDLVAANTLYRRFFLPSIRRADLVLANSHNTRQLAIDAGVAPEKTEILHPGVTVPTSLPAREAAHSEFRQRFSLADGPVLLSVGRLTPRKGLAEFVRYCLPRVAEEIPSVQLVVVGTVPARSVGRFADTAGAIALAASETGTMARLHMLGPLSDADLELAYAASELHVFPARDLPADVEGFGIVALEAAAHGLPTAAFDVGGVADAVSRDKSGVLLAPDDYGGMTDAILRLLRHEIREIDRQSCQRFAIDLSWDRFAIELCACCTEQVAQAQRGRRE